MKWRTICIKVRRKRRVVYNFFDLASYVQQLNWRLSKIDELGNTAEFAATLNLPGLEGRNLFATSNQTVLNQLWLKNFGMLSCANCVIW